MADPGNLSNPLNQSPSPAMGGGNPVPAVPNSPVIGTSPSGLGVLGQSNTGVGLRGESLGEGGGTVHGIPQPFSPAGDGVYGRGATGVHGVAVGGDGVLGEGLNGVHGRATAAGSGVWGEHPGLAGHAGVGVGVTGSSKDGDGVYGTGAHNGVHGQSASSADSGVWGENTGSGVGVAGSSANGDGVFGTGAHNGVHGESAQGTGVIGQGGWNGVQGTTANASASGVWGENTASGYGVGGKSAGGTGVSGESAQGTGVIGQGGWNGVQGTTANASASGVWGENTASGYGVGGKSAGGIGVYGTGSPAGHFDGDVVVNGDLILEHQDCAEDFEMSGVGEIAPGSVVVIDSEHAFKQSERAYDKRVAGVVSGAGECKPGIILGRQKQQDNKRPVALMGKVFCKVDAGSSPIEVGDLLTTSPTPGHAMKAGDHVKAFGAVIGKALRPLEAGQGLIPILVALQ